MRAAKTSGAEKPGLHLRRCAIAEHGPRADQPLRAGVASGRPAQKRLAVQNKRLLVTKKVDCHVCYRYVIYGGRCCG